jgi:acyl-CoA dehydrogenase
VHGDTYFIQHAYDDLAGKITGERVLEIAESFARSGAVIPAAILGLGLLARYVAGPASPGHGLTLCHLAAHDDHGNDVTAVPEGQGWLLSGETGPVLGARIAGGFLISAGQRHDEMVFRLPTSTPGLRLIDTASPFTNGKARDARLRLNGCRAGADAVIATGAGARRIRESYRGSAHLLLAAVQLAASEFVLESVAAFARRRPMFGGRLADLQAFRHTFADGLASLSSVRALLARQAAAWHRQELDPAAAAALRLTADAASRLAANEIAQRTGAHGMLAGAGVLDAVATALRSLSPDSAELRVIAKAVTYAAAEGRFSRSPGDAHVHKVLDELGNDIEMWSDQAAARRVFARLGAENLLGGLNEHGFAAQLIDAVAARGGIGACASLVASTDVACRFLRRLACPRSRDRWLAPALAGEKLGAFALTESDGGSDMSALSCQARRTAAGWMIDGVKSIVTNGAMADFAVVACVGEPPSVGLTLFAVDLAAPGVERLPLPSAGWAAAHLGELRFHRCQVPEEALLGEIGTARAHIGAVLSWERVAAALQVSAVLATVTSQWAAEAIHEKNDHDDLLRDIAAAAAIAVTGSAAARWALTALAGRSGELAALIAKLWTTEAAYDALDRLMDHRNAARCPELTMLGTRAWTDIRVQRLAGGPSELLRDFIASTIDA